MGGAGRADGLLGSGERTDTAAATEVMIILRGAATRALVAGGGLELR